MDLLYSGVAIRRMYLPVDNSWPGASATATHKAIKGSHGTITAYNEVTTNDWIGVMDSAPRIDNCILLDQRIGTLQALKSILPSHKRRLKSVAYNPQRGCTIRD